MNSITCLWCKQKKDEDNFCRNSRSSTGRQAFCKECYTKYRYGLIGRTNSTKRQGSSQTTDKPYTPSLTIRSSNGGGMGIVKTGVVSLLVEPQ